MLLALDTATPYVSVALHAGGSDGSGGSGVLHRADSEQPLQHGERLAAMVSEALAAVGATRTDLTGVAVGTGPGPFTGLRVGVVTARVLAEALGIPAYGVASLDVLALAATQVTTPGEPFVATLDARRKELFWAEYDERGQRVSDLQVTRPDAVPDRLVVGAGPGLYPDAFTRTAGPERPDAAVLARAVAEGLLPTTEAVPIYLRRPDAHVPGPPKAVS